MSGVCRPPTFPDGVPRQPRREYDELEPEELHRIASARILGDVVKRHPANGERT